MHCARAVDKMDSVVCMCAVVLLAAFSQASIIRGLYCRDPDTGKLHPINTTWPSETFCGNYSCKLRKKNSAESEYLTIQKIDLTKFPKSNEEKDMAISSSDTSFAVTRKADNDLQIGSQKDFKTDAKDIVINNKDLKNHDEYLTEPEIKTITDMLQTLKKSDLEAIVEIYNLAQDIYKEIDNIDDNDMKDEAESKKDVINLKKTEKIKGQQSYWYDPQYRDKLIDMSRGETNVVSIKKPSVDTNPTFFNGPLSEKDFGKLPYYYPISYFQRLSSYTHPKSNFNDLEKASTEQKPCAKTTSSNKYVPGYNKPMKKPEHTNTVQPTLLPYPFSYIYHYNVSSYPFNYYYPWLRAEQSRQRNYLQPYYGAYIVQIPPNINSHSKKNSQKNLSEFNHSGELLEKLKKSSADKKTLADWQTVPLPENVIEEVRAHIEKPRSFKPIPLKKNIKLERVGKVINLNELARIKREIESHNINQDTDETQNELESYIEKTVCENTTEPGYFTLGNLSQPFPACCPRKLENIHTTGQVIKVN